MQVENLDCTDAENLIDLAFAFRHKPAPGTPAGVASELSFYAIAKALAICLRAAGYVRRALQIEIELEQVFYSLPQEARW